LEPLPPISASQFCTIQHQLTDANMQYPGPESFPDRQDKLY